MRFKFKAVYNEAQDSLSLLFPSKSPLTHVTFTLSGTSGHSLLPGSFQILILALLLIPFIVMIEVAEAGVMTDVVIKSSSGIPVALPLLASQCLPAAGTSYHLTIWTSKCELFLGDMADRARMPTLYLWPEFTMLADASIGSGCARGALW